MYWRLQQVAKELAIVVFFSCKIQSPVVSKCSFPFLVGVCACKQHTKWAISWNFFHSNGSFFSVDRRPPMATIASGRPSHFLTMSIDSFTNSVGQHLWNSDRNAFLQNNSQALSWDRGCSLWTWSDKDSLQDTPMRSLRVVIKILLPLSLHGKACFTTFSNWFLGQKKDAFLYKRILYIFLVNWDGWFVLCVRFCCVSLRTCMT